MSFLIREISLNEGLEDFHFVPKEIYKDDPNWIAPQYHDQERVLNPLKNPYFENASIRIYVCYSAGKPVCRSILVINRLYWQKWNKKSAFFGFFESVNDFAPVKYLFEKIEADARASGAEYLEGPFNPNHYSELGILTDNFTNAPAFFETYNPSYYPALLKASGFSESFEFHTRLNSDISSTLSRKYKTSKPGNTNRNITVRRFNVLRFSRDLKILRDINNDAFENNMFFLPLSIKEYLFSAKYLFLVTLPRLILIAEFKGVPVGAAQYVININSLLKSYDGRISIWNIPSLLWKRRNLKELIIFTGGIRKEYRNRGIFAAVFKSSLKIFRNYSSLSTTWISDENLGRSLAALLEMNPDKHFSIYSKPI